MKRLTIATIIVLIVTLLISVIAALQLYRNSTVPKIFVGIDVAYANGTPTDFKQIVDKVKNITNLIVIGSLDVSLNQTALNETCDYISNAGMHFIVLFTKLQNYTYDPFEWMTDAKIKYGDKFLGVYRYDEPGGNQIDLGREALVTNATSYDNAAQQYVDYLGVIINFYRGYAPVFTSDYALHWFDYKCNYSAIFTEFTSNNTREIAVAQNRGAATSFEADWGAITVWKYDAPPYIESGGELYNDMIIAYRNGAKYIIVFNYPKLNTYGILEDEHFDALTRFWDYVRNNPQDFGSQKAKVAYVLPENYAFGLRRPDDKIWGLFEPDGLSEKVWSDLNKLIDQYGFGFDIIYDEPGVVLVARSRYEQLFFWNQTIT